MSVSDGIEVLTKKRSQTQRPNCIEYGVISFLISHVGIWVNRHTVAWCHGYSTC